MIHFIFKKKRTVPGGFGVVTYITSLYVSNIIAGRNKHIDK